MSSSIADMFDVQDPEQAGKLALVLFAIGLGISIIGFALSVHQNDGTILFVFRTEYIPYHSGILLIGASYVGECLLLVPPLMSCAL